MKECMVQNLLPLAKRFSDEFEEYLAEKDSKYVRKSWDALSEGFKYSNIRQVENIEMKLDSIGYHVTTDGKDAVTKFGEEEKDALAKLEHEMWMEEREEMGWTYGPSRDDENLIHPDMKPWDQLTETERDKDYFFARNLIPILGEFGIFVKKNDEKPESPQFSKYYKGHDIPLIISVAGHTDIDASDIPYIEECLDNLLSELKTKDENGNAFTNEDIILMSALAEGSDRIVARWAMRNGIHVGPVLPIDNEAFENSFSGTGYGSDNDGIAEAIKRSIDDFHSILDDKMCYSPVYISNGRRNKVKAFAELSAYMVSNSHILIGIWDGRRYDTRGGTYDAIRMAYEGVDHDLITSMPSTAPVFMKNKVAGTSTLNAGEDTLIYWIEVNRTSSKDELEKKFCKKEDMDRVPVKNCGYFYNESLQVFESGRTILGRMTDRLLIKLGRKKARTEDPTGTIGSGRVFDGMTRLYKDIPFAFELSFGRLKQLNADINEYRKGVKGPRNEECLYGEDTDASGEEIVKDGCMSDMKDRFVDIFRISEQYKKRNGFEATGLLLAQSLVTVLFSLMILFSGSIVLNISYSVMYIAVTYFMWGHARRHTHTRYVEYRALAESLRVQYYWGILGMNDTVTMNCYGYLKNGMSWVRAVLKGCCSVFTNDYYPSLDREPKDRADFAKRYWIQEKIRYLEKDEDERIKKARRTSAIVEVFEIASMILALTLSVLTILYLEKLDDTWVFIDGKFVKNVIIFPDVNFNLGMMIKLVIIVTAFFLSIFVSMRSRQFTDTPQQSQAKHLMYTLALKKLNDINSATGTHETRNDANRMAILHEMGIQEIDQNNDWVFEFIGKDVKRVKSGINLKDSGGGLGGTEE